MLIVIIKIYFYQMKWNSMFSKLVRLKIIVYVTVLIIIMIMIKITIILIIIIIITKATTTTTINRTWVRFEVKNNEGSEHWKPIYQLKTKKF